MRNWEMTGGGGILGRDGISPLYEALGVESS